jgi:hypothetical protein
VSIYNYLRATGVEISKLKDLEGNECVIEFEEEENEKEDDFSKE